MKGLQPRSSFLWKHAVRAAAALVVAATGASAAGCLDRPLEPVEPRTTATIVERLAQSAVDKIDILLAIDNSRSMADKQKILEQAVPDLVRGLVNPRCLDEAGVPAQTQPPGPLVPCPAGTTREFEPIVNIHIGIISSSIGGHGADSCPDVDPNTAECAGSPNTTNNDKGRLLARLNQCGGQDIPTWNDKKFLVWDPTAMTHEPPGEAVIDDGGGNGIVPSLSKMVIGVGQVGCGYESQLESWYRFLVDPNPYESIALNKERFAIPAGTDTVLLQQRAEFLRPDSLLAIVMLTDENDCSIKEFAQNYYVGQLRVGGATVRMPRARQECTTKGPNDPCCKSCGQKDGTCPPDPTCKNAQGVTPALLSMEEDNINLRCWDQKRRFGIDFLYPTDRYTKALTSPTIPDRDGNLVRNPLFSDLKPDDNISNIRDAGLVFMAGIIGVPWQDIARDKTDLKKGFKSAAELSAPINQSGDGVTTWDVILGDPAKDIKPKDPLMIESVAKRTGTNPITGAVLVDASSPMPNPINGHEWTIDKNDDLQYACIFDLPTGEQRDCTDPAETACDCFEPANDNPLCEQNPATMKPTQQSKAKAYPGLRELAVLRGIGDQGIVASVCPANMDNPAGADFGYRPAIGTIIERLKTALGGQCLPRTLTPDANGDVPCLILEARNTQGGQCLCDPAKARQPVSEEHKQAEAVARQDPLATEAGWNCFCEIAQTTTEAERKACQEDLENPPQVNGKDVNGWCYVDSTTKPPTGNPEIVAKCPENEKRIIRFVGEGEAEIGATLFITCSGE